MRKNTLAVFLVYFTTSTAAVCETLAADGREGAWNRYFQASNGDSYFFDASRVEKTDDLRRVRSRIQYRTSIMGASSYLSLLEIDCSALTKRVLQSTFFTDKHWRKPAMKTNMKEKPKTRIEADSEAESLANILCN